MIKVWHTYCYYYYYYSIQCQNRPFLVRLHLGIVPYPYDYAESEIREWGNLIPSPIPLLIGRDHYSFPKSNPWHNLM